jgi:hypothetical protein
MYSAAAQARCFPRLRHPTNANDYSPMSLPIADGVVKVENWSH